MARVVHFEVHAENPERAQLFYERVFGWKLTHMPQIDYRLISTGEGPGIDGGLVRRRGPSPSEGQPVNAYVCTLGVDDLDTCMDAGVKAGGTVALPRMPILGVGYVGYLKDTEGNIFGLHQADPNAK